MRSDEKIYLRFSVVRSDFVEILNFSQSSCNTQRSFRLFRKLLLSPQRSRKQRYQRQYCYPQTAESHIHADKIMYRRNSYLTGRASRISLTIVSSSTSRPLPSAPQASMPQASGPMIRQPRFFRIRAFSCVAG